MLRLQAWVTLAGKRGFLCNLLHSSFFKLVESSQLRIVGYHDVPLKGTEPSTTTKMLCVDTMHPAPLPLVFAFMQTQELRTIS